MSKKREASAPAENTVREDYDANEWGNIELPGLSDQELHGKNWNHITSMRDYYASATPEEKQARWDKIGKKNKGNDLKWLYKNNPELRQRKSHALKEAYAKGVKKAHFKGKHLDKEHREKISKAHKGKKLPDEWKENISRAKKGMDPAGGNHKPVKTPYGVFGSLREAGEYEYPITGRKYNPNRMTNLLKDPNSGYKRISKQEYEQKKSRS